MKLIKELTRTIDFENHRWNDNDGLKVLSVWLLAWNGKCGSHLLCLMDLGGVHARLSLVI